MQTNRNISVDDLDSAEPYLFIGLPAISLFTTISRSLEEPTYLIFIDGRRIDRDTCAPNFLQLFNMLMMTKDELNKYEV